MATIVQGGTGTWNATGINAPWVLGVVPTSADDVQYKTATTLTLQVSGVCDCLTFKPLTTPNTGVLTAAGSGATRSTFRIFGTGSAVVQSNAPWFSGEVNLLAANVGARMSWEVSDASSQANAKLIITGTGLGSGKCLIKEDTGATGWQTFGNVSVNWVDGGKLQFTYVNVSNCGGTGLFWQTRPTGAAHVWTGFFKNCIVSNCGSISTTANLSATNDWYFDDTSFLLPSSASQTYMSLGMDAWASGIRRFRRVRGEGKFQINGTAAIGGIVDWDDVVLRSPSGGSVPLTYGVVSAAGVNSWDKVALLNTNSVGAASNTPGSGLLDRTLLYDDCSGLNHHSVECGPIGTLTWKRCVQVSDRADEDGDAIQYTRQPAAPCNVTQQYCLALPSCADSTSGSGSFCNISIAGVTNVILFLNNNTCYLGKNNQGSGGVMSENYGYAASQVTGQGNAIFWRFASGATGRAQWRNASVPANAAFLNWNYNWAFNVGAAGTYYTDAGAKFNPNPPGANDVVGEDPRFFAPTRNPRTWIASLGYAATMASFSNEIMKLNDDTGVDPLVTLEAYFTYQFAGFIPLNSRTATTGSAADQVGAMPAAKYPTKLPIIYNSHKDVNKIRRRKAGVQIVAPTKINEFPPSSGGGVAQVTLNRRIVRR